MGWQKRGRALNSLTGVGANIGAKTGKTVNYATRNKRCITCEVALRAGRPPRPHDCRRNHFGSSKSMEPAAAVELERLTTWCTCTKNNWLFELPRMVAVTTVVGVCVTAELNRAHSYYHNTHKMHEYYTCLLGVGVCARVHVWVCVCVGVSVRCCQYTVEHRTTSVAQGKNIRHGTVSHGSTFLRL